MARREGAIDAADQSELAGEIDVHDAASRRSDVGRLPAPCARSARLLRTKRGPGRAVDRDAVAGAALRFGLLDVARRHDLLAGLRRLAPQVGEERADAGIEAGEGLEDRRG